MKKEVTKSDKFMKQAPTPTMTNMSAKPWIKFYSPSTNFLHLVWISIKGSTLSTLSLSISSERSMIITAKKRGKVFLGIKIHLTRFYACQLICSTLLISPFKVHTGSIARFLKLASLKDWFPSTGLAWMLKCLKISKDFSMILRKKYWFSKSGKTNKDMISLSTVQRNIVVKQFSKG